MSVLDVLLEGFDPGEARGWHGRWVRGSGGKPGRLEGSYNGVKLERGVAYQGRLATGEIHTGTWNGKLTGRGVSDPQAQPEFRHVDTGAVRTFQGGEFFGKLSSVKGKRTSQPRVREAAGVLDALLSERFVSQDKRSELASKGHALHVDGKDIFPISTAADAKNAVTLWLSGHHKTAQAKAHIVRNARRVGATDQVARINGGG